MAAPVERVQRENVLLVEGTWRITPPIIAVEDLVPALRSAWAIKILDRRHLRLLSLRKMPLEFGIIPVQVVVPAEEAQLVNVLRAEPLLPTIQPITTKIEILADQ
jgi:hypothetical protein